MCGRFVVASSTPDLVELFGVDVAADHLPGPSWNIAPTSSARIIFDAVADSATGAGIDYTANVEASSQRRLEGARWGLVPGWARDRGAGPAAFNARIETAHEKPLFRNAVARRRALVPANGYYEWKTIDGAKTPHYIFRPDGELTMFAGLYEWWRDPAAAAAATDTWVLSMTILTREAPGALSVIHDRSPVFLTRAFADDWLDPGTIGSAQLLEAVSTMSVELAEQLEVRRVNPAVGNVRNDGAHLIEAASL